MEMCTWEHNIFYFMIHLFVLLRFVNKYHYNLILDCSEVATIWHYWKIAQLKIEAKNLFRDKWNEKFSTLSAITIFVELDKQNYFRSCSKSYTVLFDSILVLMYSQRHTSKQGLSLTKKNGLHLPSTNQP